jgi:hypothetical protein
MSRVSLPTGLLEFLLGFAEPVIEVARRSVHGQRSESSESRLGIGHMGGLSAAVATVRTFMALKTLSGKRFVGGGAGFC